MASRLRIAAYNTLKVSTVPNTPRRKYALDRLREALKVSKKHPDMINYKYRVANRRHEYQIAVKEHREKEITDFFKNLNDYDAGVRVRKTYNYLKDFVKRKKQ